MTKFSSTSELIGKIDSLDMTKFASAAESISKIGSLDMTKFSRAAGSIGKIRHPDMTKFARAAESIGKIGSLDMTKFARAAESIGKIGSLDMTKFASASESIGKIGSLDMTKFARAAESIGKISHPDMAKFASASESIGKIRSLDMTKFASATKSISKIGSLDMTKFASLRQSLTRFSDETGKIDWESLKLTDEDIMQYKEILENENAEAIASNELSENKVFNKVSKSIKSVILFTYHFIIFLAAFTQVAQYVENTVIPIVQSYHEQEEFFQSEKAAIKWINDELKKNVSSQITKNFRIVAKNDLVVRKSKTKDSRINGKLNIGNVVQIVEKRKNWSYVIYSNHEDGQVVEGWVFTRYLRQIR